MEHRKALVDEIKQTIKYMQVSDDIIIIRLYKNPNYLVESHFTRSSITISCIKRIKKYDFYDIMYTEDPIEIGKLSVTRLF